MTPNFRFNKTLTKRLLQASPREEDRINLSSLEWNSENSNQIFGLQKWGLFKSRAYLLQPIGNKRYRLIIPIGKTCGFYLIDNIEEFINYVGIQILDVDNKQETTDVVKGTAGLPSTGVIMIDEDALYVYDHKNYTPTCNRGNMAC